MNVESFKDMYLTEMQEARSLEKQLIKALPKMVEKAADSDLKEALKGHLAVTRRMGAASRGPAPKHGEAARESCAHVSDQKTCRGAADSGAICYDFLIVGEGFAQPGISNQMLCGIKRVIA